MNAVEFKVCHAERRKDVRLVRIELKAVRVRPSAKRANWQAVL
jgi:hypothetical protein